MDKRTIQDLAIAYAQAKLIENRDRMADGTSREIRSFLKYYHFALLHIPEEDREIDLSTLC